MTITFGDTGEQKDIKITKECIHKVFGYPNDTQKLAPRPPKSTDTMRDLVSKLGLGKIDFRHKDLLKKL